MIAEYIENPAQRNAALGRATMLASVLMLATMLVVFVMSRFTKLGQHVVVDDEPSK